MVSLYANLHWVASFSINLVDSFETVNGAMGTVGGGIEVGVAIDMGVVGVGAKVGLGRGVAVGRAAMVASTAAAIAAWVSVVGGVVAAVGTAAMVASTAAEQLGCPWLVPWLPAKALP